jgi:hypothetical protein
VKLTPHERNVLKGKIRQAFRQSDRFKQTLMAARVELPPLLKKDGSPAKRNQVRFKCAHCGGLFPQKWASVDHISPVVPLWLKEHDMPIEDIVYGIYCDISNLQVLCSTPLKFLPKGERSCHGKKTLEETFLRKCFEKEEIYDIQSQIKRYKQEYLISLEEKIKKQKEKEEKRLLRKKGKK